MADRPDEQGRVGEPATEDDLRVLAQAVDDRLGADVGVGRDDPVAQRSDRRPQLGQLGVPAADPVEDVVAADHPKADAGQPQAPQPATKSSAAASGLAAPKLPTTRPPDAR